jgi:(E)-4-hydroxy-3-methylbut-2-enyl-diphosphate synthase
MATPTAPLEALARAGALPLRYLTDAYRYHRRPTRVVMVGDVAVGGATPIRVQSMTTTDTMDTDATVAQTERLVRAGCEIVRITAPTVEDARNLGAIRRALRQKGIRVPLVADIHFSPAAALEAANHVEKVRINPGNFADSKRFAVREYSDAEYLAELRRIEDRFAPLVERCRARGIAMRIGTNHGSLSDRIMNRFGDTPLGMVESALEFVRICARLGYHDVVFSMKASNPKVMVQAYRLLAARLDELGPGWAYPFHLGVTEAGNGEDGRIKSAIGIGSLLADGIGDTIRVSLTEEPEAEVPVAFALARPYQTSSPGPQVPGPPATTPDADLPDDRNPYEYRRRQTRAVALGDVTFGAGQPVRVVHPFPGPLGGIAGAPARAVALAGGGAGVGASGPALGGAGLVPVRPDVLAVLVRSAEDAAALHRLRAALDAAGAGLPLLVRVSLEGPDDPDDPDGPQGWLNAVAADGAAVCLDVGPSGSPAPALERALARLAPTRRPVFLEATVTAETAETAGTTPDGGGPDPGAAADGAVRRLLDAAGRAERAGCLDLAFSIAARDGDLALRTYRLLAARLAAAGRDAPIHLVASPAGDVLEVLLRSSVLLGALLCDGIGDSVQILGATGEAEPPGLEGPDDGTLVRLAFNVLQGAGVRLTKTEFVACPSCGRTLFDLQETTERIQRQTGHLKGVKIAVMGCIVNGPGEMADADFGYVGGAPGKVNLYVGKECLEKGVPAAEADARLIDLIRRHGKWTEPPPLSPAAPASRSAPPPPSPTTPGPR